MTTQLVGVGVNITPIKSGLKFAQTISVTVANTTAETALTDGGVGSLTIPANFLQPGVCYTFWGSGFHSAAGNPTLTINAKLNGNTFLTTGPVTSGNANNAEFDIRGTLTCRSVSTSGTIFAQGAYLESGGNTPSIYSMVNLTTNTVDTTVDLPLTMTIAWGTASSGNTITMTNFTLQALVVS